MLVPFILKCILEYVEKKYSIEEIISEYEEELDLDPEFTEEIKLCYEFASKHMKLRDYQLECINEALEYYQKGSRHQNFQIRWCCGLGKTRTACSILKLGDFKSICIGLPSILLVEQFYQEIKLFFPNVDILKVGGISYQEGDSKGKQVTNKEIKNYLASDEEYKIVLTTYHSSKKIMNEGFKFDICVADEAHHLESKNQKLFSYFLEIPCGKKLLLTATPNLESESKKSLSFHNSKALKGKFNSKSVKWAIEKKFITDYRIVILNLCRLDIEDFDKLYTTYQDINLILSAFSAVKAIYQGISKKILIYCNKVDNAKKVEAIIDELLEIYNARKCSVNPKNLDLEIVNRELNGTNSQIERNQVLTTFKRAKVGIISSVQLFGEGFDYPGLDTVIFAEKMTSDIRIIQSGLRPCRKDNRKPKKIANIIIPIQEGDISKPKQVLTQLKKIDDVRGKISLVNCSKFHKTGIGKLSKSSLSEPKLESILKKIRLEILEDTAQEKIIIPNMRGSKILEGELARKLIPSGKLLYKSILIMILEKLKKTRSHKYMLSQLSFRYQEKNIHKYKGYCWHKSLGISIVGCEANKTFKEVIRIAKQNNIHLDLNIKLKTGEEKHIKI